MKKRLFYFLVLVAFCVFSITLVGCSSTTNPKDDDNKKVEATVKGISIATAASKVTFDFNEEFSAEGLKVQADYTDNTHKDLANTAYTVDSSLYKKDVAGTYKITISYNENKNYTCQYEVTVKEEKKPVSLTITGENNILFVNSLCLWNTSEFGLKVTINYNDGTKEVIEDSQEQMTKFDMEEDNFFGIIDTEEGTHTLTLVLRDARTVKGTFEYQVIDTEALTIKSIKVKKGPTINTISSMDEFDEAGMEVVVIYNEYPNNEFEYSEFYVVYPEELTIGVNNFEVVSYDDDTIKATFPINVVDLSEYVLTEIKLYTPYRNVYFVGEEDVCVVSFGAKVEKLYKKGNDELKIYSAFFEITNDGEVDTTAAGVQKFTISVENSDITCEIEVEVKEITLEDGVYLGSGALGMNAIVLKVVNGKAYLYDSETRTYSEEANDIIAVEQYNIIADEEVETVFNVVFYRNEETMDEIAISYVLEDGKLVLYSFTLVKESDLITIEAYDEQYNFIVLYKVNGKLTEEEYTYMSALGKLYLDEECKNEVTLDTVIDGNVLYLNFVQEDYTGKPFLGKYYVEGVEAMEITATAIISEGTSGNYMAEETEDSWIITQSGISMVYNKATDDITFDFYGMFTITYTKNPNKTE